MAKFNQGDKLFWLGDFSQVTVLKVYPDQEESNQNYLIRYENGTEGNEREIFLFKSDKFVDGAIYREEEIVYSKSSKKGAKPVEQKVLKVYKTNDRIFYECENEDGEVHTFTSEQLTLYPKTIIVRDVSKKQY